MSKRVGFLNLFENLKHSTPGWIATSCWERESSASTSIAPDAGVRGDGAADKEEMSDSKTWPWHQYNANVDEEVLASINPFGIHHFGR